MTTTSRMPLRACAQPSEERMVAVDQSRVAVRCIDARVHITKSVEPLEANGTGHFPQPLSSGCSSSIVWNGSVSGALQILLFSRGPRRSQELGVRSKWFLKARENSAVPGKPTSRAMSVMRLRGEAFINAAARSRRTRRTWLFSVSPVTPWKMRWKWNGEKKPMVASRASESSPSRCSPM